MKRPLKGLSGRIGRRSAGAILAASGILLIGVGLAIFVPPVVGLLQRSNADTQALHKWKDPGAALSTRLPTVKTIPQPGTTPVATSPSCGSGTPASSFALLDFPTLSGIEGVAGNGTWSMLRSRSVVHYESSPGPGQPGNGLYALHREPNFEPLGTLTPGDSIILTNRTCQQFTYVIKNVWTEYPSRVTQLDPISSGTWITVITCTPLWIDTQRLVFRAELQTA
ncbi:MAG TPA: sortase [Candidatus Dormibacteraeota bacterium]|nr:sortase [Candidatus Dormibacteraeota bacterium]